MILCTDIETIPHPDWLISPGCNVQWTAVGRLPYVPIIDDGPPIERLALHEPYVDKLKAAHTDRYIEMSTSLAQRVRVMTDWPALNAELARNMVDGSAEYAATGTKPALHPLSCQVVQVSFGWWETLAALTDGEQAELAPVEEVVKTHVCQWDDKNNGGRQVGELMLDDGERAKMESRTIHAALKRIAYAVRGHMTIVTFNGKDFDLPILRMRSMLLSLPSVHLPWDGNHGLLYPWDNKRHCDLRRVWGNGNRYARGTLKVWSDAMGIDSEEHGADVFDWVQQGKWDSLRNYGETEMHNLCHAHKRAERIL